MRRRPIAVIMALLRTGQVACGVGEAVLFDKTISTDDIIQSQIGLAAIATRISGITAQKLLRGEPALITEVDAASVAQHASHREGPICIAIKSVANGVDTIGLSPVDSIWQALVDFQQGGPWILVGRVVPRNRRASSVVHPRKMLSSYSRASFTTSALTNWREI